MRRDDPALVPFPDLLVQAVVLLLQVSHLLQVGGQAVVQVLHGGLLVGADVEIKAVGKVEASGCCQVARLAGRDAGPVAAGSAVDAHGLVAVGSVAERHAGRFGSERGSSICSCEHHLLLPAYIPAKCIKVGRAS